MNSFACVKILFGVYFNVYENTSVKSNLHISSLNRKHSRFKSQTIQRKHTLKCHSKRSPSFISFLCVFAELTQIMSNENVYSIDPFLSSKVSIHHHAPCFFFFHLKST